MLNLANLCNLGELYASLIFAQFENHLEEGDYSNFLLEIGHFLDNIGELTDIVLLSLHSFVKVIYFSFAKGLHHMIEPLKFCADQTVDDILFKQLGNIEHIFAEENAHAHFYWKLFLFLDTHVWRGCIG